MSVSCGKENPQKKIHALSPTCVSSLFSDTSEEVVFFTSADSQITACPPYWLPLLQSAACLLLWWGVRGPSAVHGPGVGPEDHSGSVGALHLPLLDLEAITGQQLPGHHHEGVLHVLALLRSQIQV